MLRIVSMAERMAHDLVLQHTRVPRASQPQHPDATTLRFIHRLHVPRIVFGVVATDSGPASRPGRVEQSTFHALHVRQVACRLKRGTRPLELMMLTTMIRPEDRIAERRVIDAHEEESDR